jgi:hypothetical protein
MKNSNTCQKKKTYVTPEITSYEVEQDAYAMGSPGGKTKWLDCSVFFGCCDRNVAPFWGCKD